MTKSETLQIRVTPEERDAVKKASKRERLAVSVFCAKLIFDGLKEQERQKKVLESIIE